MSLQKYVRAAWDVSSYFLQSLSKEDADALRADIEALGEDGWHSWVAENQEAIFSLLASTPAKIAKRKDWKDDAHRRRLALAAHHSARLAALALNLASELGPGGGYRDTCAQAARGWHDAWLQGRWFWPYHGPPPLPFWEPPEDFESYTLYRGLE
jgi:hypothetical protein